MEVSIIGSGTMATGIAQVICNCVQITKVNIIARTEAKAANVIDICEKGMKRLIRKSKITEEQASTSVEKFEKPAPKGAVKLVDAENIDESSVYLGHYSQ